MLDIGCRFLDIHDPMKKAVQTQTEPRLYSVRDLSKATGASIHQIGHWVRRGILARTTPAGPHTAYTEEHRLLLLAFMGLRAQGWDLRGASRELHTATDSRLRQVAAEYLGVAPIDVAPFAGMVGTPDPPVSSEAAPPQMSMIEAAPAEREPAPPQGTRHAKASESAEGVAYRASSARARELWEHIAICPGVFVGVRSDADTEARRVAEEIQRMFGVGQE